MRRPAVLACAVWAAGGVLFAGEPPPIVDAPGSPQTLPPVTEAPDASRRPLPISLATAFRLADARALDVALAAARVRAAAAALDRAELLWLPNIVVGGDYTRHDGQIQDIQDYAPMTLRDYWTYTHPAEAHTIATINEAVVIR